MGLTATNSGTKRTPAPAGTHLATCFGLVDLGVQTETFEGKTKKAHKCWVWWELADETTDDGQPVTVGSFYSVSLNEKANLRKMLESWRGRPFTADELNGFHLPAVVGKACMLNILHETKKDGGIRERVAGVMPLPKGVKAAGQRGKTVVLDLDPDQFDRAVYDHLPNFLKDMILKSDEGQLAVNGGTAGPHPQTADEPGGEEIPF